MNHPLTKVVLAAALLAVPVLANAQASSEPRTPVDGGAIIIPPDTDPKAVKPAPKNIDPGVIKPAPGNVERGMEPDAGAQAEKKVRPKRAAQPQPPVGKKRSREADCKGPAELCKQDSPK
ncbi:MAG TPA: hypothetical protein VFF81_02095 [Noviherbaspirillum sp.]|nr:hypothetical protein [Noviherbaspirillum sp.]